MFENTSRCLKLLYRGEDLHYNRLCVCVFVCVAAHKTQSVLKQAGLAIYSRYTDGETGGITDSESEFVFKTEPTERSCHGDGCYEEPAEISLLTGRG